MTETERLEKKMWNEREREEEGTGERERERHSLRVN
jgi:hypothetical protein